MVGQNREQVDDWDDYTPDVARLFSITDSFFNDYATGNATNQLLLFLLLRIISVFYDCD